MKKYIAFDIGAESGRCVVGDLSGDRIQLREIHRFPTHTKIYRGDLYWDILAIFEELKTGLIESVKRFDPGFNGISVDTWGVDYVLLGPSGQLLDNPHHYRSRRTDGMIEKSFQLMPQHEIYHHTGIQFMQLNTLFQLLADRKQKPNMLENVDQLLPIPNFFLYLLSGIKKAEYTIVSTTQLSNPRRRDWSWELIKAFGFPEYIFPEVVEPGTRLGNILPELAENTGVPRHTPIIASASHDTAAAVASVPATQGNWAYLSSGTWSLMGIELDEPLINRQTMESNFTNEGGVSGTIRFLKNIAGLWLVQECRRFWEESGSPYGYAQLAELASEEDQTHAWIDPDDTRFLKPGDMPKKVISFLEHTHQRYQNNVGWITRCILESLAFKYRVIFKELEVLTNQKIDRLHVVGGGIQNESLCQMTADAINREVIAGPIEGTVVGNIGIQAIAMEDLSNLEELRQLVTRSFQLKTYNPAPSSYWKDNEEIFRSLITH